MLGIYTNFTIYVLRIDVSLITNINLNCHLQSYYGGTNYIHCYISLYVFL